MTNARDEGTLIGVMDINGKEIANGDRIHVLHVMYPDTPREAVEDAFNARVFYHSFMAAFLYMREGVAPEDEDHNTHHFNSTSSKYEILKD